MLFCSAFKRNVICQLFYNGWKSTIATFRYLSFYFSSHLLVEEDYLQNFIFVIEGLLLVIVHLLRASPPPWPSHHTLCLGDDRAWPVGAEFAACAIGAVPSASNFAFHRSPPLSKKYGALCPSWTRATSKGRCVLGSQDQAVKHWLLMKHGKSNTMIARAAATWEAPKKERMPIGSWRRNPGTWLQSPNHLCTCAWERGNFRIWTTCFGTGSTYFSTVFTFSVLITFPLVSPIFWTIRFLLIDWSMFF